MKQDQTTRIKLVRGGAGTAKPAAQERKVYPARVESFLMDPHPLVAAFKKLDGSKELIQQFPNIGKAAFWRPVASFSVCQKTGTAAWLDIWDSDHFDGFTDMPRCISDCRAWFSDKGFTFWDSAETRTGRINCHFRAPSAGLYICYAQLQSYAGPAVVECVIDSSSFGPLSFNGSITQPHTCDLSAGFHSFRIRQMSGAFFFNSLTVWKIF
jgi:hypothetical protein